jgi:CheY-like chemotaxis protein
MAFKTALIVDDSKLARVTLKKKLEAQNLQVSLMDSAEDAYKNLQVINPDIIFMDHLMPDIDGFEATQHIRQMPGFENIPIVMCTGKDHDGYLQEALAIGANFILSKPPVDEDLQAIIASGEIIESIVESVSNKPVVLVDEIMPEAVAEPQIIERVVIEKTKIDSEQVKAICQEWLGSIYSQLTKDVVEQIPPPTIPLPEPVEVDMQAILSSIKSDIKNQTADLASTLKISLLAELLETLDASIGEKIARAIEQDVEGILDLRLNVVMADKFAETYRKMEILQNQFNEKMQALHSSEEMLSIETPLTLEQPGGLKARMDQLHGIEQLYEEQMHLRAQLKIFQILSVASVILAGVAIVVAFL